MNVADDRGTHPSARLDRDRARGARPWPRCIVRRQGRACAGDLGGRHAARRRWLSWSRWCATSWPGAWGSMPSPSCPCRRPLSSAKALAGAVVAVMYAGGNVLEDFAVARAERDLKSLVDRAPRVAHRRGPDVLEDVPIEQVAVGDAILVRAGEVIPVDGVIASPSAVIDDVGADRRAHSDQSPRRRAGAQRHAQRRRDVRAQGHGDRRGEHLCRHRAHGDGRADGEGAVHSPGRSLCAAAAAGHAHRGGRRLASLGRCDPRAWRCWLPPRRVR